ncbi:MAG: hypothetical protein K2F91_02590 [Muribaculaceae bacterium]|nr:hypothetical protein [Muribaculaceae bacterium]
MDKALKYILLLLASVACGVYTQAQTIVRKGERVPVDSIERVIVAGDTVEVIIPERNFGRFDRGLFNYLFIPKGKWGFGVTASYGELQTEDIQVLSMLKDFDFKGKMYSIKPSVAYFFRSNQAVGLKFDYTRGIADLANMAFEFDSDLNFTIRDVSYYQQSFSVSTFYRNYVGLDTHGRFGVFNEVDLAFGSGSSRFKRLYAGEPKDTRTIVTQGSLNFSPGVCVFIQDYVSFNVSFGVFGLKWRKETQTTNGVDEGSRVTSGANFRFNIFNINFGLMVVI